MFFFSCLFVYFPFVILGLNVKRSASGIKVRKITARHISGVTKQCSRSFLPSSQKELHSNPLLRL